ncbi:hypothetical protein BGI41_06115 [Methanobrevibacter sp. 87.7]|uniref:hypothetical protein n=1 Tax=Methanobrevibacter sp. 87.7 TaxID=387957 RepID=UPI000B50ED9E|nr:hypothetical protein [Methanobrevibacter sp. 87.7]OWT32737.1 hypothetical protein BGI41_06115 [Methanobrevibacter sp. 87.7]
MENKNIIIILSVIIIILVAIIGISLINNTNFSKENTNIAINGNSTLYKGEPLIIKLSDKNGNGIGNQNITMTLTDSNGNVNEYTTITDNNGEGRIAINVNNSGHYTANIKYNGNNEYNESSIIQEIIIKDIVGNNLTSNESDIDKNRPSNTDPRYKHGDSSVHHESETVNGWNPSEHEVSREDIGDGKYRINYDDGYYRICDENGYVITYGY